MPVIFRYGCAAAGRCSFEPHQAPANTKGEAACAGGKALSKRNFCNKDCAPITISVTELTR